MKICCCPIPEVSATLHTGVGVEGVRGKSTDGTGGGVSGKTAASVDSYNVVTIFRCLVGAIVVHATCCMCFLFQHYTILMQSLPLCCSNVRCGKQQQQQW